MGYPQLSMRFHKSHDLTPVELAETGQSIKKKYQVFSAFVKLAWTLICCGTLSPLEQFEFSQKMRDGTPLISFLSLKSTATMCGLEDSERNFHVNDLLRYVFQKAKIVDCPNVNDIKKMLGLIKNILGLSEVMESLGTNAMLFCLFRSSVSHICSRSDASKDGGSREKEARSKSSVYPSRASERVRAQFAAE
jgi:hypothetical protein